ncbi:response regulator [Labrys okinawensis]|uniref:response regulator n=1 Tax=Labrys okinawensis TaxID=346911 RepID=UPI0039BC2EC3
MSDACILLVETDILIRTPLAEYLRDCGYRVMEATAAGEARELLVHGTIPVDIVMIAVSAEERSGFELAAWVRSNKPDCEVVLAGTPAKAAEKAGDLCEEGPALGRPYDHKFVLEHIKRLMAARQRDKGKG